MPNYDMLERMEKLKKHRVEPLPPHKKRKIFKKDEYLLLDGIGEEDFDQDHLLLESGFKIILDK